MTEHISHLFFFMAAGCAFDNSKYAIKEIINKDNVGSEGGKS